MTPQEAIAEAKPLVTTYFKEHFIALYLNVSNNVIYKEVISLGTLNASLVHPREVFYPAIKWHSASIIVLHNHPSESLDPSDGDIKTTNRLKNGGQILGIEILDHLIFIEDGSFNSIINNLYPII